MATASTATFFHSFNWNELKLDHPKYSTNRTYILSHMSAELDTKDFKEAVLVWAKTNKPDYVSPLSVLEDWRFIHVGKNFIILKNGGELPLDTLEYVNRRIEELVEQGNNVLNERKLAKSSKPIPNPDHEAMIIAQGIATQLEDLIILGKFSKDKENIQSIIFSSDPSPTVLRKVVEIIQELVDEFNTFTEEEISEGWSSKKAFNKSREEYSELRDTVSLIVDGSKRKRSTKKKKTESSERKAEKATQLMKFKKEDSSLNLVSIDPTKIIGASGLLVYNVKDEKISLYIAQDSNGLSVKGTTIQNFDPEKSGQKKLRKPKEQLSTFHKVRLNRAMVVIEKNINGKFHPVTGRINPNVVLMEAWK